MVDICRMRLFALAFVLACCASIAHAQRIVRIGWIHSGTEAMSRPFIPVMRDALRSYGHIEGRTYRLDLRYVDGRMDRYRAVIADAMRAGADILVVPGYQGAVAAKQATGTIPIVGIGCGVELLVQSLARPGGNLTGITCQSLDLTRKQFQVLREAVPGIRRVALLYNAKATYTETAVRDLRSAAVIAGNALIEMTVASPGDFAAAVAQLGQLRPDAVFVVPDLMIWGNRSELMRLLLSARLPAMAPFSELTVAGGLISYGADIPSLIERAAWYVDRIARGARPADLPMEQPTKFELAVNLTTAKFLGVRVSPSVLLRADRIIK